MTRDSAEFSAAVLVGAVAGAALALSLRPARRSRSRPQSTRRGRSLIPRRRGSPAQEKGREALAGAFLSALSQATSRVTRSEVDPEAVPARRYLEKARTALAGIRERASAHLPSPPSPEGR